jgi:hypothetical protein
MKTRRILSGETMEKILAKKSFSRWLGKLNGYEIIAPILKNKVWNYDRVHDPADVILDYPNTVQSPKKIVFPQREVFLKFSTPKGEIPDIKETLPQPAPALLHTSIFFCTGSNR